MDNDKLYRLAINDKGFVFDPQTGESYTVSSSGKVILQQLIMNKDQDAIAKLLVERFDVTANEAKNDIRDFIHHLRLLEIM